MIPRIRSGFARLPRPVRTGLLVLVVLVLLPAALDTLAVATLILTVVLWKLGLAWSVSALAATLVVAPLPAATWALTRRRRRARARPQGAA